MCANNNPRIIEEAHELHENTRMDLFFFYLEAINFRVKSFSLSYTLKGINLLWPLLHIHIVLEVSHYPPPSLAHPSFSKTGQDAV